MKFGPVTKAVGLVALACLALLAIKLVDRIPVRRLASLAGVTLTVSDQNPTPVVSPGTTLRPVSGQLSALSLGTVAVQTFSGSSLVRTGSGTVVSSDGLILTTAGVAPYGSGSYVYQIATSTGSLLRARSVWRLSGLTLLKVDATDLDAVLFDDTVSVSPGDQLSAIGATVYLSRYEPVVVPATMPYAAGDRQAPLSLDRTFAPMIWGARVVDSAGRAIGIVQAGNPSPTVIFSRDVNAFVNQYLSAKNTK